MKPSPVHALFILTTLWAGFIAGCGEDAKTDTQATRATPNPGDTAPSTSAPNPAPTTDPTPDTVPAAEPLFPNSIVSTDIDFIHGDDPDSFEQVVFTTRGEREMPDSRGGDLLDSDTYVFNASFSTGANVEIWAHSSFPDQETALSYAAKIGPRLGKLPSLMLGALDHVVLHTGDAGAFAESDAAFFVVYADNIDTRISNNDFEETVFHESVHATLDNDHLTTAGWTSAQLADGNYITDYAQERSDKEDMAETALFVYAMTNYPGRLEATTEDWVNTHLPNRKAYLAPLFE